MYWIYRNPLRFLAVASLVIGALFVVVSLSATGAFAHGEDAAASAENGEGGIVDQGTLRKLNVQVAVASAVLLLILMLTALGVGEGNNNKTKKIVFWSMVFIITLSTFFFVGSTLYINLSSVTKGPVHWHADFRIFACGREIEPVDVGGLSNKLGTNVLHEHEDRRIHVEGVVIQESDVALDAFFEVQGGKLSPDAFTIPTNEGLRTITNGDQCDDGKQGVWQVFLYTTDDGVARQQKLHDFAHYVPSPHTNVPPGDCIIFEFGTEKGRTDSLCDFYKLEADKGNLEIR